jgi:hypothetical protein
MLVDKYLTWVFKWKFTIQDNHIHIPCIYIQHINENSINQAQHKHKPFLFHFHCYSSRFKERKSTRETQPNNNKTAFFKKKKKSQNDNLACNTCFRTNLTPISFGLLAKFCRDNNKKAHKLNIIISRHEHVQNTNVLDTIVL